MLMFESLGRKPRVHFSGIGGTAMVAGARLAIEAGWEVRGSDNPLYPPTSDMVTALGVPVATGYAAANLDWQPDVVIIGNALSRGNAEVEAVLERNLHYVSLPEWLKDAVLRKRRPVVISGTHGKTTTTNLTAFLLDRAGLNPGFLIGGQPLDFPHSARLGDEGAPFVIEGDEYDTAFFDKRAKFFHYLPQIAVVTSVEFDHGDIYNDVEEIERAFRLMLRQIPKSGKAILCADVPRAAALREHAFCDVVTYGFDDCCDWRVGSHTPGAVEIGHQGAVWGVVPCPLPGRHNLLNMLAAIAVAHECRVGASRVAEAFQKFKGVKRRMEVFLEADGVTFVDDFAHHPTAIRETIAAARSRWPERTLKVLFEPRSNTTVTNRFQDDLLRAFRDADEVWFGPIHRVDAIPVELRLDRTLLANLLAEQGVRACCADNVQTIVDDVIARKKSDEVVLILSNGAFGGIYELFRKAMRKESGSTLP